MTQLGFGAFLAPHHPIGEHPFHLFQRDLAFASHLDRQGFDELWVGEHHSSGWETIGSPEMFLAAASQVTSRIKLATGVISLPYHHPFTSAQRMVQLDYMSGGRAIFGTGPGALQSDARMFGIDAMLQRDRQDEALGVIVKLLEGKERVTHECEWFTLQDAKLQLLPLQEKLPLAAASSISPSGMQLAGKHGIGVVSIASASSSGLQALPTQWSFAEEAAAKHGKTVNRADWRITMFWHIAETRQQAQDEVIQGLHKWNNEYKTAVLAFPGARHYDNADELMADTLADASATTVIGTPDDAITAIRNLQEISGGVGAVLGFAHDWANREATLRSWELFARYVVPEFSGHTRSLRESAQDVAAHSQLHASRQSAAIMAKIQADKRAAAEMEITARQMAASSGGESFRPAPPSFEKA